MVSSLHVAPLLLFHVPKLHDLVICFPPMWTTQQMEFKKCYDESILPLDMWIFISGKNRSENFPILWFWLEAKPLIKFSIPKIVCHSNASWSGQFPKTKGESVIGTRGEKNIQTTAAIYLHSIIIIFLDSLGKLCYNYRTVITLLPEWPLITARCMKIIIGEASLSISTKVDGYNLS